MGMGRKKDREKQENLCAAGENHITPEENPLSA